MMELGEDGQVDVPLLFCFISEWAAPESASFTLDPLSKHGGVSGPGGQEGKQETAGSDSAALW